MTTNIRGSMPRATAKPNNRMSRPARRTAGFLPAAHLYGLWAFAVAQPILDLIGREPDFIAAHRLFGLQLLLLALGLALFVPTALAAPLLFAAFRESRFGRVWTGCFSALFAAAFLLQLVDSLPGAAAVLVACAGGIGLAVCLNRYRPVSTLIALTAAAALIAPITFLARPAVRGMLTTSSGADFELDPSIVEAPALQTDLPIVFVVFDELPTSSLQRPDGSINEHRFPAFAALAAEADWYSRAVTTAMQTTRAIPSLLTGKLPVRDTVALYRDHPANLLSWLATRGGYRVVAYETASLLCPPSICTDQESPSFWGRLRSAADDLSVVYGHLLLPESLAVALPDVTQTLSGFRDRGRPDDDPMNDLGGPGRGLHHNAPRIVDDYLDRIETYSEGAPTLHFLHLNLPHVPWKYLPSGLEYTPVGSSIMPPGFSEFVPDDLQLVTQGWRRHLLQVGYADRVLGQIVDRLKSTGIYERALIVVTADHGRSFRPGERGRVVLEPTVEDILEVPLLVKNPGQGEGAVFEHTVRTIDIVPTIAAALGAQPPWEVDGTHVNDRAPRPVTACCYASMPVSRSFETDATRRQETRDRLYELFGDGAVPGAAEGAVAPDVSSHPFEGVFAAGPRSDLLGRAAAELTAGAEGTGASSVSQATLYGAGAYGNVQRETGFVPSLISGRIEPRIADGTPLAVSVDGVVRATTSTSTDRDASLFSALVHERWLPAGSHRIGAYTIEEPRSGDLGASVLRPLPGIGQQPRLLIENTQLSALELPGGTSLTGTDELYESDVEVVSGGIRGHLTSEPDGERPDEFFVFDGEELIYRGEDDSLLRRTWKGPNGPKEIAFRIFMPASSTVTADLRVLARRGDRVQDISPSTQMPGTFELSRNASGRAVALLRRPIGVADVEPRRIEIGRSDDGVVGFLDGGLPNGPEIGGWAADLQNPGRTLEIVAFLGGQEFWVGQTGSERKDVAGRHGQGHRFSGFLLLSQASSATDKLPQLTADVEERIRREGLVAYAASRRGVATRLRFSYRPIERRRGNAEILPVSDGRELVIQAPGDGFDGAIDLVSKPGLRTLIEGWAADLDRGEASRQIVVYRGEEHLATLGIDRERPDIASHFDNELLLRTGFRGAVRGAPDPLTFAEDHRVFAVLLRGTAVELPILPASTEAP